MPSSRQTIEIPSRDGIAITADMYLPETGGARGVVVLCHGSTGHRRWGFLPFVAKRLQRAGIAALSIDFTHNGTGPGQNNRDDRLFTRPDLFERNTLALEYEDLKRVIRWLSGEESLLHAPPVGLMGHSRGCVAAVLNAIEEDAVRALVTWAATSDPDFYTRRQKERWRREGRLEFGADDGTRLAFGIDFLDDLEQHHARYHLAQRVRELRVPHLVIHGSVDATIGVDHARILHDAERDLIDRKLVVVTAGHTFGVTDRVAADPPKTLVAATDHTVNWFETHLTVEHP